MSKVSFRYSQPLAAPANLVDYIKDQARKPESFVGLPFDADYQDLVKKSIKGLGAAKGSIIVAGIGGSNLGALAVYSALRPSRKLKFVETLDARKLRRVLDKLEHPATLVIISESGATTETMANAAVVLGKLGKKDRVVAITNEGTKLWDFAEKKGYLRIPRPKGEVTGRYSVFSAVGLVPLALAGVKTDKLLKGAAELTKACLDPDISKNPAAQSALAIWENLKAGKAIHDNFIFEPDLEYFGRWYRQLTGESVGKSGKGITPTVSIGTSDLHSVVQLYLDGPKDKFTTFISVKDHGEDFVIPKGSGGLDELVPAISGKKFGALLAAVLQGVKAAYQKQKLPFAEIELADISEEAIGSLLQMKMIEMTYLGKLLGVNPFNEPAVDLYKEEVRKLLKNL